MKIGGLLKYQHVTILIDTGSTNNFMNSKVAARLALQIKDCNRFDVKVADGRILKYNKKCSRVRLVLEGQEIVADFFLLPLDNYEVLLGIEWLSTIGDMMESTEIEDLNPFSQLAKISSASAEPSRLPPSKLHDLHTLSLPREPPGVVQPYCYPHLQKAEARRIAQKMKETRTIRPPISPSMTLCLHKLYIFVYRDQFFLKYHIQSNQLWLLSS
ncbi:hypothetical protein GW17_00038591 [Ensete ventricosum]|nr:hypothetical protein GW17_00038591 [Ensete ventricosum]